MSILLTNDDGISSPLLPPLKTALSTVAETIIFTPDRNWSAAGHPKTMHKLLRADPLDWPDGSLAYQSSGAPSDCVALALLGVLPEKPQMVVSGINMGANLGYDVFYSGTVAAAVEGVIHGLPAIACSREYPPADPDVSQQAGFVARLAQQVLQVGLPEDVLLNVNFPPVAWAQVQGVELTRLGRRVYQDALVRRQDPRGRAYFWIGGQPPSGIPEPGTDIWAIENNFISITPLHLDLSASSVAAQLAEWPWEQLFFSTTES